jgi:hypothetical protein
MTTRTWHGGLPYTYAGTDARNPANWTPRGAPAPGDYLTMQHGQMTLWAYHNLAGNELHLTGTYNATPGAGPTGPINISMRGGGVLNVGGSASFGDPLTITAGNAFVGDPRTAANYLHGDNLTVIDGTIDVGANSNLVVTGKMTFAYTDHITGGTVGPGTRGTITNDGTISVARGDISAHINGFGTLELHQYHDGTGVQTISAAIDEGQVVKLMPNHQGTRTELVHPNSFTASLDVEPGPAFNTANPALLEVDGIRASRMDIRDDMLTLYGARGRPLWSVHEQMAAGVGASMHNTATGTEIVFTPHQLIG